MADYSETLQGAYDAIRDAGGSITFAQAATDAAPLDPAAPWEGSDEDPAGFPHIAAFVPLSSLLGRGANPFAEAALIPALNCPVIPEIGMAFTKADGTTVSIANIVTIAPDGLTPILYQCEVTPWPAT